MMYGVHIFILSCTGFLIMSQKYFRICCSRHYNNIRTPKVGTMFVNATIYTPFCLFNKCLVTKYFGSDFTKYLLTIPVVGLIPPYIV